MDVIPYIAPLFTHEYIVKLITDFDLLFIDLAILFYWFGYTDIYVSYIFIINLTLSVMWSHKNLAYFIDCNERSKELHLFLLIFMSIFWYVMPSIASLDE